MINRIKTMLAGTAGIFLITAAALPNLASAQEGRTRAPQTVMATAVALPPVAQKGKTIIVFLDITGSFVDTLLSGDYHARAIKAAINQVVNNVEVGSLVRVSIIGHSHAAVSGSYDHLQAKEWIVSKNRYPKEKIGVLVRAWLDSAVSDLRSGKIKKEENTAVVQAFDRISEIVAAQGQPAVIIAISDLDDTELGYPLPDPYRLGLLTGSKVIAVGGGVTLREGTKAERDLRRAWEKHLTKAGINVASNFVWLPNP